jgi:hypothetical protein
LAQNAKIGNLKTAENGRLDIVGNNRRFSSGNGRSGFR